ncbi:MAG: TolC family protein [Bacteroidales bacterium]|nr:TolC family protein [Bacteroidales bacterium]
MALRQIEIDSLQVERLEALLSNGKAASAEVAAQKASLAQSRVTAVQASNNLELARLEMAQLMELPSPEGFSVALPNRDRLRVLPASPERVYEAAVGCKPSVKAEQIRLDYAERNIALAKGGYLPSLSLSGGIGTNYYYTSNYTSSKFFDQLSNNFSPYVGLSLNIPIFSRMQNRNQVKSARLSYQTQQLQLETVKKNLFKEIQQAWYNAVAAQGKYESSREAEAAAIESFALVQARYENGKATITEFNESKNQMLKAESDRVQACYEALYQAGLLDFYEGKNIEL